MVKKEDTMSPKKALQSFVLCFKVNLNSFAWDLSTTFIFQLMIYKQ